jgi:hypothetical protein
MGATIPQRGGESGGFPMAVRHGGATALAPGRAAVKARHLAVRRRFVDENDPLGGEVKLPFEPGFARRVHRTVTLLGGVRRLMLRRLNRHSVPMATVTPYSFNLSRSSAKVMLDFSAKAERIRSA